MLGMFFSLHLHMRTLCEANWYATRCVLVRYRTAFRSARPRSWYAGGCSESALQLIEHLRSMGETNALVQRNNLLKRETALATAAVYQSMFGAEDGTVPATFQVSIQQWRGPQLL
uniref:Uncharacterized protein n=1 Tax=Opuntia streptacantha TaxID=393608 RepID=A0A7C9E6X0_OPUST